MTQLKSFTVLGLYKNSESVKPSLSTLTFNNDATALGKMQRYISF